MLLSFGFSACNHLFYHPDSHLYSRRDQLGVPSEDLSFQTEDGETLGAWLLNGVPESKGLVLHFHGNAQNLSAHVGFSLWLAKAGYTVLAFDYRGYGRSTGKPSQQGVILDGKAVIQWIEASGRWRKKPRIVFAQSLGGAIAVSVLADNPQFARDLDLLIIESSFPSYRSMARSKLGQIFLTWPFQYPLSYLFSEETKPCEEIKRLSMPKLIIHGESDVIVPFEMGEALFACAAEPKEFWAIPYAQHTEAFIPGSPYREKLLERLEQLAPRYSP